MAVQNVWDISLNMLSFAVYADGKDVTNNYEITIVNYGILTITQRTVTITTDSYVWVYDGQPHFDVNATVAAGSYGLVRSGVACGKICGRRYHYARPNK